MDLAHGSPTQRIGSQAEDVAAQWLSQRGFKIIEQNVRIGNGELDIVARLDGKIIFVEVKARRNVCYGLAEEAVTQTKLDRLRSAVRAYTIRERFDWNDIRLDVITLIMDRGVWVIDRYIEDVLV